MTTLSKVSQEESAEKALALRKLGLQQISDAESPTGRRPRESDYDEAEMNLRNSLEALEKIKGQQAEMFVTMRYLGELIYKRGDEQEGKRLMRKASTGLQARSRLLKKKSKNR